jgi:hypothetical protein
MAPVFVQTATGLGLVSLRKWKVGSIVPCAGAISQRLEDQSVAKEPPMGWPIGHL